MPWVYQQATGSLFLNTIFIGAGYFNSGTEECWPTVSSARRRGSSGRRHGHPLRQVPPQPPPSARLIHGTGAHAYDCLVQHIRSGTLVVRRSFRRTAIIPRRRALVKQRRRREPPLCDDLRRQHRRGLRQRRDGPRSRQLWSVVARSRSAFSARSRSCGNRSCHIERSTARV
jgi:hypothetical protein